MIGQQQQWRFLEKCVESEKIPHALLFYGADKASLKNLALRFVGLVNKQKKVDIIQPDLFFVAPVEGEKEIKIGQIRQLQQKLSLKSYSAPFKTVIVENAHQLNQEAQSAFLKLLEEPKGRTIFMLLTEYPEILLPTILSRVEKLRFYKKPLAIDKQEGRVREILKMTQSDLGVRFRYAKELAENPQDLQNVLDLWLRYFREMLLAAVKQPSAVSSSAKLRNVLRLIQATSFLIATTNVNPRLALEILMLEL